MVKVLLGTVALAAMTVAAAAQVPLPVLPTQGGGGVMTAPSGAQILIPPGMSMSQQAQPPAPVAPLPPAPQGGFVTAPPQAGAGDPANRMNLVGSNAYVDALRQQAEQRLAQLGQGAVQAPGGGAAGQQPAPLPGATIPNQQDLERLTAIQRNIQLLNAQFQEAKAAIDLWTLLYNNDAAKQLREQERREAEEARRREEQFNRERSEMERQRGAGRTFIPPVVAAIDGPVATLIVPGYGEMRVRAGTRVGDQFRVVSVSVREGVVLDRGNGDQVVLGMAPTFLPQPTSTGMAIGMQPNQR